MFNVTLPSDQVGITCTRLLKYVKICTERCFVSDVLIFKNEKKRKNNEIIGK